MAKRKYVMRKNWWMGFIGFLGVPGIVGLFTGEKPWLTVWIIFFLWFIPVKKK